MQMVTTCTIPCTLRKSSLQNSDAPIREAQKTTKNRCSKSFQSGGSGRRSTLDVVMPDFQRESQDSLCWVPERSWQQQRHLKDFFVGRSHRACQARDLCEYGYDSSDRGRLEMQYKSKTNIFSDCLQYDDKNVKIVREQAVDEQTGRKMPGIAHEYWRLGGLVKLLHAVMTSDDFCGISGRVSQHV
jgi:hypothetical protein